MRIIRVSPEHRAPADDSGGMSFYPAVVVAVDDQATTVKLEATGKRIVLAHGAHNAVSPEARKVGVRGHISFPKAPPVFTPEPQPATSVAA